MREASSLVLIRALLAAGAQVRAHDPEAMEVARDQLESAKGVAFCDSPLAALQGANALAIVTEWKAFRSPDFDVIRAVLKEPLIFDGRNLYDPAKVAVAGIEYHAIGRPVAHPAK
jgi:UDPglucose 6-dehydrogenase